MQFLSGSNVLLLFLILSGVYLWFSKVLRWTLFRSRLWFTRAPNSKLRDFNWHHVFSVWALIPLFVVVYSGAKVSYDWPDKLVYFVVGEEAPPPVQRGVVPDIPEQIPDATRIVAQISGVSGGAPLQSYFESIGDSFPDWQEINLTLPLPPATDVSAVVRLGNTSQPHLEHLVTLDGSSAEIAAIRSFTDESLGFRINDLMLPLHTGEVFGFWGQTLAVLVCIAAVILVWTGLALSWRRLVQPRLKKSRESLDRVPVG